MRNRTDPRCKHLQRSFLAQRGTRPDRTSAARVMHAVEVTVVVADRVRLGLVAVTQLVDRLHLTGHARTFTTETAARPCLNRDGRNTRGRHALNEELERIDIARIADTEKAVVLRERVNDGAELFFSPWIFPGVHGQAESDPATCLQSWILDAFVLTSRWKTLSAG